MEIGAVYVNWLLEGSVERYSMKDLGGRWQVNDPVSLFCLVEDCLAALLSQTECLARGCPVKHLLN